MRTRALVLAVLALVPAASFADPLLMTRRLTVQEAATAELSPTARAAVDAVLGGAVVDESHFPPCTTGGATLCLQGGRFSLTVGWEIPSGATGSGTPVQLTTDSGYFWFFGPENIELVVKVLNACTFNERYWVFAAGLTNVKFDLAVFDRTSDILNVYSNPLNRPAPPLQDTDAFRTCP